MNIIDQKPTKTILSFTEDSDGESSGSDYAINPLCGTLKSKGGSQLGDDLDTTSDLCDKRAHGSTSPRNSSNNIMNDIVDGLLHQATNKGSSKNAGTFQTTKMMKNSKEFIKQTVARSHISTCASEDSNSCERSAATVSGKQSRTSSFEEQITVKPAERYTNPNKVPFKAPVQQNPMAIFECMMKAAIMGEPQFPTMGHAPVVEPTAENLNVKKPVPNKFKTEMCRNMVKTGICKYGNECTYAHSEHELHKKPELPENLHSKFCKAFNQKPFVCPKGKDCTLLHLRLAEADLNSDQQMTLKTTCKYSQKLQETMSQMDKRLKHLKDYELLDLTSGIVSTKRLLVFESIVKSNDVDTKTTTDDASAASVKKPTLTLKSRAFVMPSKKARDFTSQQSKLGEQGECKAQSFINQVSDSGKAQ